MFKVNNKDTRTTLSVFIVNFEHISHLVLIVNFEHAIAGWVAYLLTYISTKILKENADLFADFSHLALNKCVKTRKFPSCL